MFSSWGHWGFSYPLHRRGLGDEAQRLHGFVSSKATAHQAQSWLMVTPASHCSQGQACVFHSSSKSSAPRPRRPNRGPGSRLAGLAFTFTAEPKTLGTHPTLPKAATVVKNHHGFPKPQHSEYLPEQAGVFQNPACPDQSISLRRSVPQLWKMFPLPKTSSLEQDHRTTSQTATEPHPPGQMETGSHPCLPRELVLPPRHRGLTRFTLHPAYHAGHWKANVI